MPRRGPVAGAPHCGPFSVFSTPPLRAPRIFPPISPPKAGRFSGAKPVFGLPWRGNQGPRNGGPYLSLRLREIKQGGASWAPLPLKGMHTLNSWFRSWPHWGEGDVCQNFDGEWRSRESIAPRQGLVLGECRVGRARGGLRPGRWAKPRNFPAQAP